MILTTDAIIRIAAAGGGMTISTQTKTTDDLVRIAAAASGKGARIIIKIVSPKTTDELVRIAAAGHGCVSFEFDA